MCKEWTKLFNETNLLHLGNYKGVKEKYNEDKVGISGIVEIDKYWTTPYPLTYWKTAELSDSRRNNGEILKIEFINNLKNKKKTLLTWLRRVKVLGQDFKKRTPGHLKQAGLDRHPSVDRHKHLENME